MKKATLVGSHMPPLHATSIAGTLTTGLTAAGTTQGTALAITDDINVVTTTALNSGVVLSANLTIGDTVLVSNFGANALSVYPPTGGKIDNGSANAAKSVAANTTLQFICINTVDFVSH